MTRSRAQDKNLLGGGVTLLRRPGVQGRAAALPHQEREDFCHAPAQPMLVELGAGEACFEDLFR
jgi:hypothetical protein